MNATHDAPEAIDTVYAGHRFRSRLEARWAVFFDVLGVAWEYEPCGYTIGPRNRRRRYLPDFYLPQERVWAEVKGSILDHALVASAIHPQSGLPRDSTGLMLLGLIPRAANDDMPWHELALAAPRSQVAYDHTGATSPVVAAKRLMRFTKHGLEAVGAPTWFVGDYGGDGHFHRPAGADPWTCNPLSLRDPFAPGTAEGEWGDLDGATENAYQAAARARFEHGEQARYARGELR